ncbi:MAG: nucleoside triphosphate pyrophosphohydrolase [Ruminococcaceae bacterium]|nr:nucleoside triphosphate pyrophosphohydrolase [Oscillospiraceae bacterium]
MNEANKVIERLMSKSSYNFDDLCDLVTVLRSENGCPWDREQTNKSIRNCIIDETYEFIEGLDNEDNELMCEELGDVLFQIVFHSDIKRDNGAFNVNDVIDGICKKMIIRHPHVFGDVNVKNSDEVLVNWENIKNDEKKRKTPYEQLDSVAKSLPSLMRAQKLIGKAQKNNLIECADFDSAVSDVKECLDNLKNINDRDCLGELLFKICSLARYMDVEAEEILYVENEKFLKRFAQ